jgi:hypothetical protein
VNISNAGVAGTLTATQKQEQLANKHRVIHTTVGFSQDSLPPKDGIIE